MITIEFDDKCTLPAMDRPSIVSWQVKELRNTTTNEEIVNGMKRAFGKYRVNENMNLFQEEEVYDCISDVVQSQNTSKSERKWIESSLSFHMVILGFTDNYEYKYKVDGTDGHINSFELIEKLPR